MARTTVDGLDTYYEMHGQGETIVLLHNGFSCAMMWSAIHPLLVAEGFRVIAYDRRGFGRSDGGVDFADHYRSDTFRDTSVTAMADLLEQLEVERFHILGQCEGGVVGVDYAVRFPDQVLTLTTASTMCYGRIPMTDFNRQKLPAAFDDLGPDLQAKYIRWHGAENGPRFFDICVRGGGCYGSTGIFDLRPAIAQLRIPCLVMYPDRGHFFDVEQGVAFYRQLINGELLVFPKCGHNIFEHYPRLYAQQVAAFIRRHRSP